MEDPVRKFHDYGRQILGRSKSFMLVGFHPLPCVTHTHKQLISQSDMMLDSLGIRHNDIDHGQWHPFASSDTCSSSSMDSANPGHLPTLQISDTNLSELTMNDTTPQEPTESAPPRDLRAELLQDLSIQLAETLESNGSLPITAQEALVKLLDSETPTAAQIIAAASKSEYEEGETDSE
jgi:hypothetical protein